MITLITLCECMIYNDNTVNNDKEKLLLVLVGGLSPMVNHDKKVTNFPLYQY